MNSLAQEFVRIRLVRAQLQRFVPHCDGILSSLIPANTLGAKQRGIVQRKKIRHTHLLILNASLSFFFFFHEYVAFKCDCTHLRSEEVVTVRVTTKLAMLKLTNGWYSGCDEGFSRLCLHLLRQTNFEQTWRPGQVLRYNIWLACYREPKLAIGRVFCPFSKSVAGPLLMTCQDKHCDTVGLHVSTSPRVGWGCFS